MVTWNITHSEKKVEGSNAIMKGQDPEGHAYIYTHQPLHYLRLGSTRPHDPESAKWKEMDGWIPFLQNCLNSS